MEFTLVQEGLTPLSADLMDDLVRSIEAFFFEGTSDALLFSDIASEIQEPGARWSDYPRVPTQLELMAACCTLENRGAIQTVFVGGRLNFASTRATNLV